MPSTLRILHISDLHAKLGRHAWRVDDVLGDAWKRNLEELRKEEGPFDLVCLTGDVAFSGRADEYTLAHNLLSQMLEPLQLPRERLFVVPGNHDIDRDMEKAAWEALRKNLSDTPPDALARWMAGGKPPLGYEPGQREQLLSRQAAYRAWVRDTLQRKDLLPENSPHGTLGYRSTLRLPHLPFEIHIIGLDSAWAAGDYHDPGKLLLTDEQVGALTAGEDGKALSGFRLALIHHPPAELLDGRGVSRLLASKVDLLLRGHLHETAVETLMEPGRTSRQFAAGSLYGGNQWKNACHAITVHFDRHGRPERYVLRFRSWSPQGGHWFDDGGVYPEARGGRLQVSLGLSSADPDPRPPPPVFIGRDEELKRIRDAVLPVDGGAPMPVVIQGMAGVGKTTLAERFFELHEREHFPGGLLRLVLDPQAPQSTEQLLRQLAERFKLSMGQEGLAERVREQVKGARMLVLVENVDSEPTAAESVALVRQLRGCAVLLTGRLQGLGRDAGWKLIEVPLFGEAQALEQLAAEWKPAAQHQEPAQRQELARELGYLPLALHLAAGYLRTGGYDVPSFLGELRAQKLKLPPIDPADRLLDGTHDSARAVLASTFELSLRLLREKLGADAERMLAALGALGHAPTSGFGANLGSAVAGLPERELRRLVLPALQLSLISPALRREGAWRIHPLVAEFLRYQPGAEGGFARLREWFLNRLPMLGAGREQEQGQRWNELHRETEALVDWLARVLPEDFVRVSQEGTVYARLNGPYAAWIAFCDRALKHPLSDNARSSLLWTLGHMAYQGGAVERALSATEEKVRLDRERKDERGVALASGLLADILQAQGQLDEALRIRRGETLPVFERLGDVRSRALNLGKIADILEARGQLDEALRIRRDEVQPVFEMLGDMRERALTVGQIADILQIRGQLDEALRVRREEELPVYEKLGDLRSRAITLGLIADILQARGQLDEALRIHRDEALPVYEKLGEVRACAVTLGRVADILHVRGQLDEALRIHREEALPVFEKLGDIRARAITLGKVADILEDRDQLDEALRIRREEVLPVYEKLGDIRLMIIGRANLAVKYLSRNHEGDRQQAISLLHLALEKAEELRLPEAVQIRSFLKQIG